ncbi:hypothetical protein JCM10212_001653 [Sporobolomyces blumeae]
MPAPVSIARRESTFSPDPARSPLLHPALSMSLSKSFGLNSPFSLSAMSTSLKDLTSSPGFSSMAMSLGRSFEERPRIEAQFFKNFTCCGLDLQDLHGLLEHFEECHVAFDDDRSTDGGMDGVDMEAESEGTISGPPSPRLLAAGGHRGVFEVKKSALGESSFEAPDSPATNALHLDGGMELDMEMGDDDEASSPASSAGSSHSRPTNGFVSTDLTGFNTPLPLPGNKKKGSQSSQFPSASVDPSQGIQPALVGFDPNAPRTTKGFTPPATDGPQSDKQSSPIETMAFPAGTVNPAQALGNTLPPGVNPGVGGLAPSLLFNGTTAGSSSSLGGEASHGLTLEDDFHIEPVQETDDEEDEDETDDEDENHDRNFDQHPAFKGPSPVSTLPPIPPVKQHSTRPRKASSNAAAAREAANALPHLTAGQMPLINPNDRATITALAHTTLKDPMQTAAAIAALGPNSLAALPTALHPLGQGVQISPSGRPYTPPSEKPFKCTIPGCDKSYKQQNGLKYHRLHGHCGANAVTNNGGVGAGGYGQGHGGHGAGAATPYGATGPNGQGYMGGPAIEGKPYVCHVASCGKRYKNMNGLRYHYQHSGAHGALGLQMLAQGCHPPPQFPPGHKRSHQLAQSHVPDRGVGGSRESSRASSPASRGQSPGYHSTRMGYN